MCKKRRKKTLINDEKALNVSVYFSVNTIITSNDGNTDILDEVLRRNPYLIRKLSELVLSDISSYSNGRGKYDAYTTLKNIFV